MAKPSLKNPFGKKKEVEFSIPGQIGYNPGIYEATLKEGYELQRRPKAAAGVANTQKQHLKKRMTIWERIKVLCDHDCCPNVLYQNWGPNLDGASLVTAIIKVNGRDVAVYGHDLLSGQAQWMPPMAINWLGSSS